MQDERLTVITGGGRGIGRAITQRMAKDTPVLVIGRTQADLELTCNEINSSGGHARFYVGDVADPTTAKSAIAGARVTNLVCNAGIGKGGATETYSTDLWNQILRTNVDGAFHFIQACLPSMIHNRDGNIVLMSSILGLQGSSHNMAYVASKHALVGMARALSYEHGKNGITAIAVCPGFVAGEMTDRSIASHAARHGITLEDSKKKISKVNPQQRLIPPEEIAEAVAFICSGKASSLAGNPFVMSGGQ